MALRACGIRFVTGQKVEERARNLIEEIHELNQLRSLEASQIPFPIVMADQAVEVMREIERRRI